MGTLAGTAGMAISRTVSTLSTLGTAGKTGFRSIITGAEAAVGAVNMLTASLGRAASMAGRMAMVMSAPAMGMKGAALWASPLAAGALATYARPGDIAAIGAGYGIYKYSQWDKLSDVAAAKQGWRTNQYYPQYGMTGAQLQKYTSEKGIDEAKTLSLRQDVYATTSEILKMRAEYSAMGGDIVSTNSEIMKSFLDYSAATGTEAETGMATIYSQALTFFGKKGTTGAEAQQNFQKTTDLLVNLVNQTRMSGEDVETSLRQSAAVLASMGMTQEQTYASVGTLRNLGRTPSQAGGDLRRLALRFTPNWTELQQEEAKELGEWVDAEGEQKRLSATNDILDKIGMSWSDIKVGAKDSQGNINGVLENVLKLEKAMDRAGFTDLQKASAREQIGGVYASTAWEMLAKNPDLYAELYAGQLNSVGEAAETVQVANDNLGGSFQNLKDAVEASAGSLGEHLEPGLRRTFDFISGKAIPTMNKLGGALSQGNFFTAGSLFFASMGSLKDIATDKLTNLFTTLTDGEAWGEIGNVLQTGIIKGVDSLEEFSQGFNSIMSGEGLGATAGGALGWIQDTIDAIDFNQLSNIKDNILEGLQNGINRGIDWMKNQDWGQIYNNLYQSILGGLEQIGSFIQNLDWDGIFQTMKSVMEGIDWSTLGQRLGEDLSVAADWILERAKQLPWSEVVSAAGNALSRIIINIDWLPIITKAAQVGIDIGILIYEGVAQSDLGTIFYNWAADLVNAFVGAVNTVSMMIATIPMALGSIPSILSNAATDAMGLEGSNKEIVNKAIEEFITPHAPRNPLALPLPNQQTETEGEPITLGGMVANAPARWNTGKESFNELKADSPWGKILSSWGDLLEEGKETFLQIRDGEQVEYEGGSESVSESGALWPNVGYEKIIPDLTKATWDAAVKDYVSMSPEPEDVRMGYFDSDFSALKDFGTFLREDLTDRKQYVEGQQQCLQYSEQVIRGYKKHAQQTESTVDDIWASQMKLAYFPPMEEGELGHFGVAVSPSGKWTEASTYLYDVTETDKYLGRPEDWSGPEGYDPGLIKIFDEYEHKQGSATDVISYPEDAFLFKENPDLFPITAELAPATLVRGGGPIGDIARRAGGSTGGYDVSEIERSSTPEGSDSVFGKAVNSFVENSKDSSKDNKESSKNIKDASKNFVDSSSDIREFVKTSEQGTTVRLTGPNGEDLTSSLGLSQVEGVYNELTRKGKVVSGIRSDSELGNSIGSNTKAVNGLEKTIQNQTSVTQEQNEIIGSPDYPYSYSHLPEELRSLVSDQDYSGISELMSDHPYYVSKPPEFWAGVDEYDKNTINDLAQILYAGTRLTGMEKKELRSIDSRPGINDPLIAEYAKGADINKKYLEGLDQIYWNIYDAGQSQTLTQKEANGYLEEIGGILNGIDWTMEQDINERSKILMQNEEGRFKELIPYLKALENIATNTDPNNPNNPLNQANGGPASDAAQQAILESQQKAQDFVESQLYSTICDIEGFFTPEKSLPMGTLSHPLLNAAGAGSLINVNGNWYTREEYKEMTGTTPGLTDIAMRMKGGPFDTPGIARIGSFTGHTDSTVQEDITEGFKEGGVFDDESLGDLARYWAGEVENIRSGKSPRFTYPHAAKENVEDLSFLGPEGEALEREVLAIVKFEADTSVIDDVKSSLSEGAEFNVNVQAPNADAVAGLLGSLGGGASYTVVVDVIMSGGMGMSEGYFGDINFASGSGLTANVGGNFFDYGGIQSVGGLGFFGGFGNAPQFAEGGYTGDYEGQAYVHPHEYIFNQDQMGVVREMVGAASGSGGNTYNVYVSVDNSGSLNTQNSVDAFSTKIARAVKAELQDEMMN